MQEVIGIIIKESSYSETSKLLTILTREHGLVSVIAKGAKRLNSNLRVSTLKLTYGKFNIYYKENKISTLSNVTILNEFKNIKKDIEKISYVSFILELAGQVSKEHFNETLFDLTINAILKIDENYDSLVIMNIVELKFLEFLGVMPVIDACSICGSKANIVTLSATSGGYICKDCLRNDLIVTDKTLKVIRAYYYVDLMKLEKINISEKIKNEINAFLDDYYDRYTGLYLKSKEFIKNLKKL